MPNQPDIEKLAEEVMDDYGQSEEFKDRFITFYENAVEDNLGGTSLEKLIDNVELPEEDQLNGS